MENKSKIDSLRSDLYKRTPTRRGNPQSAQPKRQNTQETPQAWNAQEPNLQQKKSRPYATWFLLGSGIFFVLAVAIAAFFILQGGRTVSPQHIELDVQAPTTLSSGDTIALKVRVKNTNPVSLPFAELTATFPSGTRNATDVSRELQYETLSIGPLRPGEEREVLLEAVLFGTESEEKEIAFRVEFRPENSNAIVVKESTFSVLITSSPLVVSMSAPKEVAPGELFTTTIEVQTNSEEAVPNAILLLDYPFGFSARDARPAASLGNNVWDLGTLKPGQKETIIITGDLVGTSGEGRFIKAAVGNGLNAAQDKLSLVYMEQNIEVSIVDSQLALSLSLDGNTNETITTSAGDVITGRLSWKNNLESQIFDTDIRITLSGTGFDAARIDPGRGLYRESDNSIVFNRDTNSELQTLDPGERGTVTFSIPVKEKNILAGVRNPSIGIVAVVSGREVGSGAPVLVSNQVERTVQVASELVVRASVARTGTAFSNTGPWPPKAGQPTTYTLSLFAENGTNTVTDTAVRLTLPSYVSYKGAKSPQSAVIQYDERTGELVWDIGEIRSHEGKNVGLQLTFTPVASQIGNTPLLVGAQRIEGFDRFIQSIVQGTAGERTIATPEDAAYTSDKGIVVE